jgi:spoIIIJ-associated protein
VNQPAYEASGATVEEALSRALAEAGLREDEAAVEVVSAGAPVIAGERLTGAMARVRVTPLPQEQLQRLLELMGIEARGEARLARAAGGDGEPPPTVLEVEGDDLGVLIGWRGESLRALQTVLNLMLGAEPGRSRVIVDIAHYRERREQVVSRMAERVAEAVVRTGRAQRLNPMPPYERRAVHLALAGLPGVETESEGADGERHVVIRPVPREGGEPTGRGWS